MSNSNAHSGSPWNSLAVAAQKSLHVGYDSVWAPHQWPLPHGGELQEAQSVSPLLGTVQVSTSARCGSHRTRLTGSFLPLTTQLVHLGAQVCSQQ